MMALKAPGAKFADNSDRQSVPYGCRDERVRDDEAPESAQDEPLREQRYTQGTACA